VKVKVKVKVKVLDAYLAFCASRSL
jgi:hypothetical protein